jgi:hypothetical protein
MGQFLQGDSPASGDDCIICFALERTTRPNSNPEYDFASWVDWYITNFLHAAPNCCDEHEVDLAAGLLRHESRD